jgi:hypothetical protein
MKKIFLCIAFIPVLFTGCQESSLSPSEEEDGNYASEYFVPKSTAEEVATAFLNRNILKSTKSAFGATEKVVSESFSLKDEESEAYLHAVNYEGGGFVLVSADTRLEPVLAYSEEGYFDDSEVAYPGGLIFWLSSVKEQIQDLRNREELPVEDVKAKWDIHLAPLTKLPPPEDPPFTLDSIIQPLLTTHWHQQSSYNNQLPFASCLNGVHISAGCVPVAIAQILRYNQYPTTYQWSQMPDIGASTQTQALFLNIYNYLNSDGAIVLTCDASTGNTSTGVPVSYNVGNFLKNKFNYSSATQASYNDQNVKSEIYGLHPVIIRGGYSSGGTYHGHAWVCDGLHEWYTGSLIYLFFHFNWGWGGNTVTPNYDGWYSFHSAVTIGGNTYNQNLQMVYHIRKN